MLGGSVGRQVQGDWMGMGYCNKSKKWLIFDAQLTHFPAPDSVEKGSIYVNIWGQRMSIVLTNDLINWGFLLYRKVGRSKTASVARSGNIRAWSNWSNNRQPIFAWSKDHGKSWQVETAFWTVNSPCFHLKTRAWCFFSESKINVLDPTNSLWTKTHQGV